MYLVNIKEYHNLYYYMQLKPNKPKETNQKPAGGFLIAHFKRYVKECYINNKNSLKDYNEFIT